MANARPMQDSNRTDHRISISSLVLDEESAMAFFAVLSAAIEQPFHCVLMKPAKIAAPRAEQFEDE